MVAAGLQLIMIHLSVMREIHYCQVCNYINFMRRVYKLAV